MTSIIVIEDDVDSMDVLCEFLQIKGLDVIGKGVNGFEGMKLYNQFCPDAVIMDVMMPEFDGFYGLDAIKKIDPTSTVIMITADMAKNTRDELIGMGASEILYKPKDLDKIVPTIEKLMDEKNQSIKLQLNI